MHHVDNEKWKKKNNTRNRPIISGKYEGKENYSYTGVLQADTIGQAEIKRKKRVQKTNENTSRN